MANPTDNTIARIESVARAISEAGGASNWDHALDVARTAIEASGLLSTAQQTEELREALSFYANFEHYTVKLPHQSSIVAADCGGTARAALAHTVEIKPA